MNDQQRFVAEMLVLLGNEEKQLKDLGAFAQAEGIRLAVVRMLKHHDEFQPEGSTLQ